MTAVASSEISVVADVAAALALFARSAWHSQYVAADVLHWLLPPIALGQYIVVREAGRPVAYASWAFVDDDAHEALRRDTRWLQWQEWQGGGRIWVVDLIAPYGHVRQVVRALRMVAVAQGLKDKKVNYKRRILRRTEDHV